jgi:NAD(P)-dependent dehydrogenase (short-subunit alcohol dehydrogenase family)
MEKAVVTGGAQGIGKAICLKLMSEKVHVFVFDNDEEALEDFGNEIKGKGSFTLAQCDVGDAVQLQQNIDKALGEAGLIRYLVNNAAIFVNKPIEDLELEEWNRVIAVNLTSSFLATKYLAQSLKATRGSVLNICSTRAFMSKPGTESYSAGKGGIYSLTHSLAISLQPHVRVNCLSPGWIDVTAWQKQSKRKKIKWDKKQHLQHPAGRIGIPEDIAALAWFLLSDQAGFITGQNFIADGGMTRKMIYLEE